MVYATILVSAISNHKLSALLLCCVLLIPGCATTTGKIYKQRSQTLHNVPVEMTSISVPKNHYISAQVAAGSVWAAHGSMSGFHKTIKVDMTSREVTMLSRPWTSGVADLLVDDHSLWLSDGMTRLTGNGDLYRFDIESNQLLATVEAAGIPFDFGDGAVWAYNPKTRTVTEVDTVNNQARRKLVLVTKGWRYGEYFAFGAGSIWQTAFVDEVSALQLAKRGLAESIVRRIDPTTDNVIAEIPIGPFLVTGGIRYVGEAIWVLGEREEKGKPYAIRIDIETNTVVATIPLVRSMEGVCAAHSRPMPPVFLNGYIWVATFCSSISRVPYVLLKVDLASNQVIDELRLPVHGGIPSSLPLATGDGSLWAFDGESLVRIDFYDD